jgi:hypothetical protein
MNDVARSAPATSPPARDSLSQEQIESQLILDLGGAFVPSGPSWESLPEASRTETLEALARLLAKADLGEAFGA